MSGRRKVPQPRSSVRRILQHGAKTRPVKHPSTSTHSGSRRIPPKHGLTHAQADDNGEDERHLERPAKQTSGAFLKHEN